MKFRKGIKILAFISLLLGIILLSVCTWTFLSFWKREIKNPENLNSTTTTTTRPHFLEKSKETQDNAANGKTDQLFNDNEKVETVTNMITEIKSKWSEFQKFLLGSNGLAFFAGIVQIFTNVLLLCTGAKGIRNRGGCWKYTHFSLAGILIVSLMIPAVYDISQDSLSTLRDLFGKIKSSVKDQKFDEQKFTEIEVFYGILALDISVIFTLVILSCCLMRNADYDYEYA